MVAKFMIDWGTVKIVFCHIHHTHTHNFLNYLNK